MKKDLITVIIPFKDRSEVVYRALDSVYEQEYRPIEIILVDDASVSALDITKYSIDKDIQIMLLKNQHNLGPGASRGIGRINANGQFIAYLDSDDYWDKSFLSRLYKKLSANKKAGMAFSNTKKIKSKQTASRRFSDEEIIDIVPSLFFKRYWSTSSCLWRADVSLAQNWYPYRDHEDYLHDFYGACINNKCIAVNEGLCFKVQDAPERIPRSNMEFLKSITALDFFVKSSLMADRNLKGQYVLFILRKFYKRQITVKFSELKYVLTIYKQLLRLTFVNFKHFMIISLFFFFWLFNFRRGLRKIKNLLVEMNF